MNDLAKAAKAVGATVKTSDLVGPSGQVPDFGAVGQVAPQLFDLSAGAISGPINAGRTGVVVKILRQARAQRRRDREELRPDAGGDSRPEAAMKLSTLRERHLERLQEAQAHPVINAKPKAQQTAGYVNPDQALQSKGPQPYRLRAFCLVNAVCAFHRNPSVAKWQSPSCGQWSGLRIEIGRTDTRRERRRRHRHVPSVEDDQRVFALECRSLRLRSRWSAFRREPARRSCRCRRPAARARPILRRSCTCAIRAMLFVGLCSVTATACVRRARCLSASPRSRSA